MVTFGYDFGSKNHLFIIRIIQGHKQCNISSELYEIENCNELHKIFHEDMCKKTGAQGVNMSMSNKKHVLAQNQLVSTSVSAYHNEIFFWQFSAIL